MGFLRQHPTAQLSTIINACLPGSTAEWVNRIISDLEWFGYVTVYYSRAGKPITLEITDRGLHGP